MHGLLTYGDMIVKWTMDCNSLIVTPLISLLIVDPCYAMQQD